MFSTGQKLTHYAHTVTYSASFDCNRILCFRIHRSYNQMLRLVQQLQTEYLQTYRYVETHPHLQILHLHLKHVYQSSVSRNTSVHKCSARQEASKYYFLFEGLINSPSPSQPERFYGPHGLISWSYVTHIMWLGSVFEIQWFNVEFVVGKLLPCHVSTVILQMLPLFIHFQTRQGLKSWGSLWTKYANTTKILVLLNLQVST